MGREYIKVVNRKDCPICKLKRRIDFSGKTWSQVMCLDCQRYFYLKGFISDSSICLRGLEYILKGMALEEEIKRLKLEVLKDDCFETDFTVSSGGNNEL